jgi:predicted RNA-binding protein YlqC (UPF0109 family)
MAAEPTYRDAVLRLVQPLVEHTDALEVIETRRDRNVLIELLVHATETGRVVGKGRDVARALQTLLDVVAERRGDSVTLDVKDA